MTEGTNIVEKLNDKPVPFERLKPQNQTILRHLKQGHEISQLVAFNTMNIASLTTRIAELRRAGYDIESVWKQDHAGRDYVSYRLKSEAPKKVKKTLKGVL